MIVVGTINVFRLFPFGLVGLSPFFLLLSDRFDPLLLMKLHFLSLRPS